MLRHATVAAGLPQTLLAGTLAAGHDTEPVFDSSAPHRLATGTTSTPRRCGTRRE